MIILDIYMELLSKYRFSIGLLFYCLHLDLFASGLWRFFSVFLMVFPAVEHYSDDNDD